MAKNTARKFSVTLKESMEEEELNRRLKAAGVYDHSESYEVRKQLYAAIEQSKEDAKNTNKLDSIPEKMVSSFDDDFNIVDDDDSTETSNKMDTSSSTNKSAKKHPEWREFSEDEDDQFQTKGKSDNSYSKVAKKSFLKNAAKQSQNKPLSIDSKKFVQTPVESYGNKMVSASIKKIEDKIASPSSGRRSSTRRGDLIITPDEVDLAEIEEFPEITNKASWHSNSRKNKLTLEKKSDTDEEDFIVESRLKETVNRYKTHQLNSLGHKTKISSMKALCKKYSEMLNRIENVTALPFPEDPDYDCERPCQQLILNEQRLKIAESSNSKPIKWRKPIILGTTNNRRRRQIFNQPSTSRNIPPEDIEEDGVDIVCDSSPASMEKLDISPASPILESSASRPRSNGSNGITETEMEVYRKSPTDIKEDSVKQECPICCKLFPLSVIEDHADGCLSNTDERPRSERVPRSARSNKSSSIWFSNSPWGKGPSLLQDRAARTSIVPEEEIDHILFESETSQPDSDFEPDYDPGTKRNQRKTGNVGVKKRRT